MPNLQSDKPVKGLDITEKNESSHFQAAEQLLRRMTLKQKLNQLSGDLNGITSIIPDMVLNYNAFPIPAGEDKTLGIEPILFADGPRGIVCGQSTCFPVSMARGASWDIDLEARIGDAIGVEMRSQGANYFGGVCINLLRHPAWGRAQETYGEDTFLLGEFGTALVQGVQRHGMACIKHFAVNSIENSRFKVNVEIEERTLREVYLPHFKKCVDAGAASVMSAYNKVNGEWASHNEHLLKKILRDEWGFDGFVISDFIFAIRSGAKALKGGMDIEMPYKMHFGLPLRYSLWRGNSSEQDVNESVRRILAKKLAYKEVGETERYGEQAILCDEHINLALESAQKSIVLLKNSSDDAVNSSKILPLDRNEKASVAVIGRLAKVENIGDKGSSEVRPPRVVTPWQGLQQLCMDSQVSLSYHDGKNIHEACQLAASVDYVIVCAGFTHKDEGEFIVTIGGDRDKLSLRSHDQALINALSEANPNVIVSMFGGSAIITENWKHNAKAILMAWYAGMEGGTALAQIIFGDVNPSGKLPCSFPKSEDDLPYFSKTDRFIRYEYLQGYRHLEHFGYEPAFHFGFGLSYTDYSYSNLTINRNSIRPHESLEVSVDVENTGNIAGEEVVQLYVGYPQTIQRANKDLKGFKRIALKPGEKKTVSIDVSVEELRYFDEGQQRWLDELGEYQVLVGASSREEDLLKKNFQIIDWPVL